MIKHLKYGKNNIVNPLFLVFSEVNEYFEEIDGNKYLTLDPTDESKQTNKQKYGKRWIKIRDLVRSITKNSDDYDLKYMKIKLNSDDQLLLNEMIEIFTMTIVVKAAFHENDKYYPNFFFVI